MDDDLRVLPWWLAAAGLAVAVLAGWLVLSWLLGEADSGDPRAALRIEAIRTGLTVVAGVGGAIALLLAARRQWIKERAQRHDETVAAREQAHRQRAQEHLEAVAATSERHQEQQLRAGEHDATERRVTDLYTTAADLLGSDRPAIRIAGLFALERLAQDHPGHRQMIVEVICAYLRLPRASEDVGEAQVLTSAQRLLARHLRQRPPVAAAFWPDIQVDLAGARLADLDLSGCELASADFSGTVFAGPADLSGAVVHGPLRLSGASFEAAATFDGLRVLGETVAQDASFTGPASLERLELAGAASFTGTSFAGEASFRHATFRAPTTFDRVRFGAEALFDRAVFEAGFSAERVSFLGGASFRRVQFAGMVLLRWSVFSGAAIFEQASFDDAVALARAEFHQSARFDGARLRRRPTFDRTRASAAAPHTWPDGCGTEPADDGWLLVVDQGEPGAAR